MLLPTFMALRFDSAATKRRFSVFGLTSNMLVNKHSYFLALGFLTGVNVICTLGLSSMTTSVVDSIVASTISLNFVDNNIYLHVDMSSLLLFIHLCSKEDLVHNDWSIPTVFIWYSRHDDCNIHLITTSCCSNVSIYRIESMDLFNIIDLTH